jgi:hypothetical protein
MGQIAFGRRSERYNKQVTEPARSVSYHGARWVPYIKEIGCSSGYSAERSAGCSAESSGSRRALRKLSMMLN